MSDLLDGKPWQILQGDALTVLRTLPAASVHCCVTSPPYWNLRNYSTDPQVWPGDAEPCADGAHEWGAEERGQRQRWGDADTLSAKQASNRGSAANVAALERKGGAYCQRCNAWLGELGGEPTPALFVSHLVAIFREVRRVLHPSGSLWLNLGDSYANDGKWGGRTGGKHASGLHGETSIGRERRQTGLKPKDLIGVPWMVALALRDDGWWLRSDVIWWKPNGMCESVTDRPNKDHEYLFLLTKSRDSFFDMEAVREPAAGCSESAGSFKRNGSARGVPLGPNQNCGTHREGRADVSYNGATRHLRTVWRVTTTNSGEDHFASYPPELVRRPVLASTSAAGNCSHCGAPYAPIVEKGEPDRAHQRSCGGDRNGEYHGNGKRTAGVQAPGDTKSNILASMRERRVVGWTPGCRCCVQCDEAGIPLRSPKRRDHAPVPYPAEPATVLDPFAGTGTTLAVAVALGRRAIGIELQPRYVKIAQKRLRNSLGLFGEIGLPAPGVVSGNGHAAQPTLAGLEAGG